MSVTPIYLDNAATTEPLPEVVEAMARVQREHYGNPSSPHRFGQQPRKLLDDAREFMRGSLGSAQLILTSGGTEADLLGILGAASCREPGTVLAAASDHPAILAQEPVLSRQGHRLSILPVTEHGDLCHEALTRQASAKVRVLVIQHGHNELGTLSDIDKLVAILRHKAQDAHIHVDLVQAFGKIPFDLETMGVDSVAVSAHKFHGPRGIGCLAISSKARIAPLQLGGGQELGMRGGTENVAAAVGMAVAAEAALSCLAENMRHCTQLADLFFARVAAALPQLHRLGHPQRRLPHVLSLRLPGIIAHSLQERMDVRGVAFSTGSACHGKEVENHVLAAIGLDKKAAREVLRISFSKLNHEDEVARAADLLIEEAVRLQTISTGLS